MITIKYKKKNIKYFLITPTILFYTFFGEITIEFGWIYWSFQLNIQKNKFNKHEKH